MRRRNICIKLLMYIVILVLFALIVALIIVKVSKWSWLYIFIITWNRKRPVRGWGMIPPPTSKNSSECTNSSPTCTSLMKISSNFLPWNAYILSNPSLITQCLVLSLCSLLCLQNQRLRTSHPNAMDRHQPNLFQNSHPQVNRYPQLHLRHRRGQTLSNGHLPHEILHPSPTNHQPRIHWCTHDSG